MSSDSLESLIREFEPYLKSLARRHLSPFLRTQIDSTDLVQSAWAHLLRAQESGDPPPNDRMRLRGLLGAILRNRIIDHARRMKASQLREQSQAQQRTLPTRPSELAQANELWGRMHTLCAEQHRPILDLKRQGLSLDEIARQTGLHPSSVRRILYDLARQVALDAGSVDRRG